MISRYSKMFSITLLALGVPIQAGDETWSVKGRIPWRAGSPLRLRGSGASLRFLLPCLALEAEGPVRVEGSPRLFSRPLAADAFEAYLREHLGR